jgi:hypothetical protein
MKDPSAALHGRLGVIIDPNSRTHSDKKIHMANKIRGLADGIKSSFKELLVLCLDTAEVFNSREAATELKAETQPSTNQANGYSWLKDRTSSRQKHEPCNWDVADLSEDKIGQVVSPFMATAAFIVLRTSKNSRRPFPKLSLLSAPT